MTRTAQPGPDERGSAAADAAMFAGLFRAVYTLLRVAPAWKVYKRLQRRVQARNATLSIELRVRSSQTRASGGSSADAAGILGFGESTNRSPRPAHALSSLYAQR